MTPNRFCIEYMFESLCLWPLKQCFVFLSCFDSFGVLGGSQMILVWCPEADCNSSYAWTLGPVKNHDFHDFEKLSLDLGTTRKHTPRTLAKRRSFASEAEHDS